MATLTTTMDQRGFTLIEIIVGIVVSAILAVILVQIVSGQTLRSFWPVQRIDEKLVLQEVLNRITADHRQLLITDPTPLVTLQGRIQSGEYWTGRPFNRRVALEAVANLCIEFDADRAEDPLLAHENCQDVDKILKVTLQVQNGGQRLTALFTR
jgi:prepilin-type N-terminal cleavage/methylation domain-containing protein